MSLELPQVWQDEGGDSYWCEGHPDPTLFALASGPLFSRVSRTQEAGHMLADLFLRAPLLSESGTYQRADIDAPASLIGRPWMRQSPDNEEQLLPCAAGDEGAQPFSRWQM